MKDSTGGLHALILSGGQGERFGSKTPKQFTLLKERPILLHSILAFLHWKKNINITLVVPPQQANKSRKLIEKFLKKEEASRIQFVHGGEKRHLSCLTGLQHILQNCPNQGASAEDIILIHDAARPLLRQKELDRLWREILKPQSRVVSLASPISESIVRAETKTEGAFGPIRNSLEREGLYAVKTPQAAKVYILRKMIEQSHAKDDFTDLLSWAEHCDIQGIIVEAEPYNWKVTRKTELCFLEAVLDKINDGSARTL